jgi:hypothetical protein
MNKTKFVLFLIAFLTFSIFATNVHAFPMLGFGIIKLGTTAVGTNETSLFEKGLWGFTLRYKGFGILGFIIDIYHFRTGYWIYQMEPNPQFYGPDYNWGSFQQQYQIMVSEEDWNYYHDEFIGMFDIAFFLAFGRMLSFHFAFGPTYWWASPSKAYDTDSDFQSAYDSWYNQGGFKLGMNVKLGANIVFGLIGITLEYNYVVNNLSEFFNKAFSNDPNPNDDDYYGMDYLKRMGFLEFALILWL